MRGKDKRTFFVYKNRQAGTFLNSYPDQHSKQHGIPRHLTRAFNLAQAVLFHNDKKKNLCHEPFQRRELIAQLGFDPYDIVYEVALNSTHALANRVAQSHAQSSPMTIYRKGLEPQDLLSNTAPKTSPKKVVAKVVYPSGKTTLFQTDDEIITPLTFNQEGTTITHLRQGVELNKGLKRLDKVHVQEGDTIKLKNTSKRKKKAVNILRDRDHNELIRIKPDVHIPSENTSEKALKIRHAIEHLSHQLNLKYRGKFDFITDTNNQLAFSLQFVAPLGIWEGAVFVVHFNYENIDSEGPEITIQHAPSTFRLFNNKLMVKQLARASHYTYDPENPLSYDHGILRHTSDFKADNSSEYSPSEQILNTINALLDTNLSDVVRSLLSRNTDFKQKYDHLYTYLSNMPDQHFNNYLSAQALLNAINQPGSAQNTGSNHRLLSGMADLEVSLKTIFLNTRPFFINFKFTRTNG